MDSFNINSKQTNIAHFQLMLTPFSDHINQLTKL